MQVFLIPESLISPGCHHSWIGKDHSMCFLKMMVTSENNYVFLPACSGTQ